MKRVSALLLSFLLALALLAPAQAATSYSASLCMPQPTQGDPASQNTWGNLLNTGISIIDSATQAATSISVAGNTDVILSFSCGNLDQTDAAHFTFTGLLTGNITVFWPSARNRMFSVTNSTTGAFTLTLAVNNGSGSPAGTTQVIARSSTQLFIDDGTNILPRSTTGINNVTQQTFTASGTYTPTSGTKFVTVQEAGGGAGGFTTAAASGGGGGGAGECAFGTFTAAQLGVSQTVTIGAAGGASTNGGTTSLGALLTAVGGAASTNGISGNGGIGGTGGTGTGLHTQGGDGGDSPLSSTTSYWGGHGGASCFGGGGKGGAGNLDNGSPGRAYGSGGGGGGLTGGSFSAGGAGATGAMIITEYQ